MTASKSAIQFELSSPGALAFRVKGSGVSATRELLLRGAPLYENGGRCKTCCSMFAAAGHPSTPLTPEELSERLAGDVKEVTSEIIDTVSPLLPAGRYLVGLLRAIPMLRLDGAETWRSPMPKVKVHDWVSRQRRREKPAGESSRGPGFRLSTEEEVLLPHRPLNSYDRGRVRHYQSSDVWMRTALALSVIEWRDWSCQHDHTRLTHFLLDGHHKTMAASDSLKPLQILSFLNLSESEQPHDLTIRARSEYYARRPEHWACPGDGGD